MSTAAIRVVMTVLAVVLSGCTLSRPHYDPLDVRDGDPSFVRAVEAHTNADVVGGNRAEVLLNGDQIFPALDRLVHRASQAHFGRQLQAGVKIYEYEPAFLHAKTIVVDEQWVSIGSANLDNRSFALNNELNLAFFDRTIAARLTDIFRRDLKFTRRVTYDDWQRSLIGQVFYVPLAPLRDQLKAAPARFDARRLARPSTGS